MERREPYNQLWWILFFVSIVLIILWILHYRYQSKQHTVAHNISSSEKKTHRSEENKTVSQLQQSDISFERYIGVESPLRFKGTEGERIVEEAYARVCYPSSSTEKPKKTTETNGYYLVQPGDTLSRIAWIFKVDMQTIMMLNHIDKKDSLRAGEKLVLPLTQDEIEAFLHGAYEVKEGDTLLGITKRFGIDPKLFAKENNIVNSADIYPGRVLILPFKHLQEKKSSTKKRKKRTYPKFMKRFGKHALRVTATAYTSHCGQTDSTPFLAAWNNRLRPGMKVIAVSRDLIWRYGLKNGTKVRISGLPGIYRVRDKMNKRYRRRIDIYMGMNRRKALRWGRRSVVIYW